MRVTPRWQTSRGRTHIFCDQRKCSASRAFNVMSCHSPSISTCHPVRPVASPTLAMQYHIKFNQELHERVLRGTKEMTARYDLPHVTFDCSCSNMLRYRPHGMYRQGGQDICDLRGSRRRLAMAWDENLEPASRRNTPSFLAQHAHLLDYWCV